MEPPEPSVAPTANALAVRPVPEVPRVGREQGTAEPAAAALVAAAEELVVVEPVEAAPEASAVVEPVVVALVVAAEASVVEVPVAGGNPAAFAVVDIQAASVEADSRVAFLAVADTASVVAGKASPVAGSSLAEDTASVAVACTLASVVDKPAVAAVPARRLLPFPSLPAPSGP